MVSEKKPNIQTLNCDLNRFKKLTASNFDSLLKELTKLQESYPVLADR